MKTTFLTIFSFIFIQLSYSQTSKQSYDRKYPILTEKQMLEDIDSLQSDIDKAGIHSTLNEHLKKIDLKSFFEEYRKTINSNTTPEEFAIIVDEILNLVQDGHANLILKEQSIKNAQKFIERQKLKFDSTAYAYAKAYNKLFEKRNTEFELPIKYINGKYLVYVPFQYDEAVFRSGFELIECNGKPIQEILPSLISQVSPLRWDIENEIYYKDNFYKAPKFIRTGKINLGFKDGSGNVIRKDFKFNERIDFLEEAQRKVGYFTQEEEKVLYFDKEEILYLRIPRMDRNKVSFYTDKIDSLYNSNTKISKVVLDIRGNGGGSDKCYTNILKHIISEPIKEPFKVAFPKNAFISSYFGFKPGDVSVEESPLLGDLPFYIYEKNQEIKPDSTSINYNDKIFILQDEFIYSAAGNLSALAKSNSNIITIGNRTGLCGGKQTSPVYFSLPNSKLIYRLEPMLDFSNVIEVEDLFHNEVSHYIPNTLEDYKRRIFNKNDIYSVEFLREHDPLFKMVINYN